MSEYLFSREHCGACDVFLAFEHCRASRLFGPSGSIFHDTICTCFSGFDDLIPLFVRTTPSGRDKDFRLACCGTYQTLTFYLRIGECSSCFLCSAHTFRYLFASLINDAEQRLVEEVCEQGQKQSEIHRLNDKQFPIDSECCEKWFHNFFLNAVCVNLSNLNAILGEGEKYSESYETYGEEFFLNLNDEARQITQTSQ
ncbi:MAG: hypothetical protein JWM46_686 [Candidatus Kaiserbacteria bacterium]|nr:hypothetical protein [Candidatus Kaiserbacteria bacterium]